MSFKEDTIHLNVINAEDLVNLEGLNGAICIISKDKMKSECEINNITNMNFNYLTNIPSLEDDDDALVQTELSGAIEFKEGSDFEGTLDIATPFIKGFSIKDFGDREEIRDCVLSTDQWNNTFSIICNSQQHK